MLCLGGAAGAEERAPLTLPQALERAERNPQLLAARARASGQAARAAATGRTAWPRLTASVDTFWTDNPARVFAARLNRGEFTQGDFAIDRLNHPDGLTHLNLGLGVESALDVFGQVGARAAAERALGSATEADASEARETLRLRVVGAYDGLALARRALAVSEGAVSGARAREADVEARVAEGAALSADLLRARARRRLREAELAARQGDVRVAEATLARLIDAPDGDRLELASPPGAPVPLAGDEAAWLTRALANRPALAAARHRAEASDRSLTAERRGGLPELIAYGQVQSDRGSIGSGETSGALGLGLRWTVLDAGRGRRVAAAEADHDASRYLMQAAEDAVRLEVESAYRRAQAARERWAAASGGSDEGREALRVVQERRQAGMATLTDELETEAASLAAELEELRAAIDVAFADAALQGAAGEL
jgi:outer membrane protein